MQGIGVSFREDLALGSPSQTPGQEPMGPYPASWVCVLEEGLVLPGQWSRKAQALGAGRTEHGLPGRRLEMKQ